MGCSQKQNKAEQPAKRKAQTYAECTEEYNECAEENCVHGPEWYDCSFDNCDPEFLECVEGLSNKEKSKHNNRSVGSYEKFRQRLIKAGVLR